MTSPMGPSVDTLSPEIANFGPPLSRHVSLFHLVLSVPKGANSFQLSVLFVHLPVFCVVTEFSVAKFGSG